MNDKGQTTIEYVLVAVLVILGIIFAFRSAAVDEAIGTAAENIQESLVVEE
jgi:Flp pilus assembly pilin Flp